MTKKRFDEEQNDREAIEQEFVDSEVNDLQDLSDVFFTDVEFVMQYSDVFNFLNFQNKTDEIKINEFIDCQTPLKRLELLKGMDLLSAIKAVDILNPNSSDYIRSRLDFYKELILHRSIERPSREVCDSEQEMLNWTEHANLVPDGLRVGLLRDVMYAAMISTPEMAVYKIAEKICKQKGISRTHFPQIKGYDSGIYLQTEPDKIGFGYPLLSRLYNDALKSLQKKEKNKDKSLLELGHIAIKIAADTLVKSMEYNLANRGPTSPYVGSWDEAIAWTKLGKAVQHRLRMMRQKLMGIDLSNIQRFIGKSGDSKLEKQRNALYGKIKELERRKEPDEEDSEQLKELKQAFKVFETKYNKTISPAQKAIDLHFKMCTYEGRKSSETPSINWINYAPLGLIKWTHNALNHGVKDENAFGYALARYILPDENITQDIIEKIKQIPQGQRQNLKGLKNICKELNIKIPIEDLIKINVINFYPHIFKELMNKGYAVQALIDHPWLNDSQIVDKDLFPFNTSEKTPPKGKQSNWCIQNAFSIPAGWNKKRLGKIILERLDSRIDTTIHDATYFLSEFNVPKEKNGVIYESIEKETELLYSLLDVPQKFVNRVTTNKNKYNEYFSSEAAQFVYEQLIPLIKSGKVDLSQLKDSIDKQISQYRTDINQQKLLKINMPDFEKQVDEIYRALVYMQMKDEEKGNFTSLMGELKEINKRRTKYIDESQKWFFNHSSTPRDLLVFAWHNRDYALQDGCADNPRAIKQWADINALRAAFVQMQENGRLPSNIDYSDIVTYDHILKELIRCYDGGTVITTLSILKENFNPDYEIPPMKIDLGDGWTGEIIQKADPRGMTIGYDTGCCMTVNGASATCIKAGYEKPQYGFFVLYRDGQIAAQSFIYANKKVDPKTIIADNIEANQGRDMQKILDKYKCFFLKYFASNLRREKGFSFKNVNIGTGYTDVELGSLEKTTSIPMADEGIYTDAHTQKRLLELPVNTVERLKSFKTSVFKPSKWETIKNQMMKIEHEAFMGKGYSEFDLQSEFVNPSNIVVVIQIGENIIGYCSAVPTDIETLYISSIAILPEFQGQGLVGDLLLLLDKEAKKRGFKYYTQHAKIENKYAEKIKKNYNILEQGEAEETTYGLQQFLKAEIPDHSISDSLSIKEKQETKREGLEFSPVNQNHASVIAALEKQIYPESLQQGFDFFQEELSTENEEDNVSFMVNNYDKGKKESIGYCVAYIDESEAGYKEPVLYVSDVALLPEFQKKGVGKSIFEKLIHTSMMFNGMPIEFHARDKTSYPAIIHEEKYINGLGYRIVYDKAINDYFEDEQTGEKIEGVHLVRLEKIEAIEKVA